MDLAIAILALIFALAAFPLAVYAVIITKAQQMSTHQIEYVQVDPRESRETARELGRQAPGASEPLRAELERTEPEDDFNPDEAGI